MVAYSTPDQPTSLPKQASQAPQNAQGWLRRMRRWALGERDAVDAHLREIAHQGRNMSNAAHLCALLLIILFSLGSLVALSGDALSGLLHQWRAGAGVNVPAAISVAVSTLLVLAMDVAMVYAASVLRMLNTRRAEPSEKRLHYAVMAVVAALEAGTYAYMSATYDHPANGIAWTLILARAGAAPLLAVYLSMARPLPVTSRDILAQAELASGAGVLRDVVITANDTGAPLARKLRLYGASAIMTPADRMRLGEMIAAMQDTPSAEAIKARVDAPRGEDSPTQAEATPAPSSARTEAIGASPHDDRPPTGPGSPSVNTTTPARPSRRNARPAILRLEPPALTPEERAKRSGGKRVAQTTGAPAKTAKAATGARGSNPLTGTSWEAQAKVAWASGARSIRAMRAAVPGMSQSSASKWVAAMKASNVSTEIAEIGASSTFATGVEKGYAQ